MVLNILREHFDLGESEFCNSTDSERPTEDAKRENNQFRSTTYMGSGAIPVPQEAPLAGFATGVESRCLKLFMRAFLRHPKRDQLHFQEPGSPNKNLGPKSST